MDNYNPEKSGLIISACPASKCRDGNGQNRQHKLVCRACGRPAPINADNSLILQSNELKDYCDRKRVHYLCFACKKFYSRCRNKIQNETCQCSSGRVTNQKCRVCRFERIKVAIDEKKTKSTINPDLTKAECEISLDKIDFSKLPCTICGFSSSGYHFGVISCEGCKGFFCRSMRRTFKRQYICKREKEGRQVKALCPPSSNCRKCRLQRCRDAGMSFKETALGRHGIRRQLDIEAAIRKHVSEGSLLKGRFCRRTTVSFDINDRCSSDSGTVMETSTFQNQKFASPDATVESCSSSLLLATSQRPESLSPSESRASPSSVPQSAETSSGTHFPDSNSLSNSDKNIQGSSEWLIERTVEATARLSTISTERIYFTYKMTREERAQIRMRSVETYVKCVSDFVLRLPEINDVPLNDRISLFTQAFFPITIAQLSLTFDAERQIPNHFSLDREGPSWEICAKVNSPAHQDVERFLCEAGNKLVSTIFNLEEFALCCGLLFFNPEVQNLENLEGVRLMRRRYHLAVLHLFSTESNGARMEERLCQFYGLISYLRQSTALVQNIFTNIAVTYPQLLESVWTPLVRQLFSQIVNLPNTGSSSAEIILSSITT